jgi:hypothetical protein
MAQKPEMDQGLSDAELLAMPAENLSPATLSAEWIGKTAFSGVA